MAKSDSALADLTDLAGSSIESRIKQLIAELARAEIARKKEPRSYQIRVKSASYLWNLLGRYQLIIWQDLL